MFARHSLVWLTQQGWEKARTDAHEEFPWRAAIDTWQRNDWPLIARRAEPSMLRGRLCVGLALPPDPISGVKTRIPLQVAGVDLRKITMPIPLEKITDIVPDSWRAAMAAFVNEAERSNVVLKVYGSAAMQAITGQSYMTATSDIDLLVYPVSAQDLQRALDLLVRHAACLPLDGEIVFPNGQAVAWKEWARTSSGERVLVKCLDAVALLPKSVVLSSLKEETCVS